MVYAFGFIHVCFIWISHKWSIFRNQYDLVEISFFHCLLFDLLKVSPKACGHTQGRQVVSREEAVMRIKAAVDARKESGSDIVIVARTDSRQAVSLEESLWRTRALADAGADVLFIDALASKEEMKAFCEVSSLLPKMVIHFPFQPFLLMKFMTS